MLWGEKFPFWGYILTIKSVLFRGKTDSVRKSFYGSAILLYEENKSPGAKQLSHGHTIKVTKTSILACSPGLSYTTITHGSLKGKRYTIPMKKCHQCTLIFCCCFFQNTLGPRLSADHTTPTGKVWPPWITRSCTLWPSLRGAPLQNRLSQHRSCSYQTMSWLQTSVTEPAGLVSFLLTIDCDYFPAS